jgi:hypothetical protein
MASIAQGHSATGHRRGPHLLAVIKSSRNERRVPVNKPGSLDSRNYMIITKSKINVAQSRPSSVVERVAFNHVVVGHGRRLFFIATSLFQV